MSEVLSDADSNINHDHPSFKKLENAITKPQEVVFGAPSPELRKDVIAATQIFPEKFRLSVLPEKVPTFHAAVFSPKDNPHFHEGEEQKRKSAMFFLSGVPGSGAGHGYIAAELYAAAQNAPQLGEVTIAGAIGSVLSTDVEGSRFVTSASERSAYLAAFIEELLKNKDCDDIYLVGHSFGAAEVMYLAPVLNKLFQLRNENARVRGAILHQPAALAKQRGGGFFPSSEKGLVAFATNKTARVASFIDETAYMFPTRHDFGELELKIGEAQDKGDYTRATELLAVLEEMKAQPARNQQVIENNLTDEEKARLQAIDKELEEAASRGDASKEERLYQKRLKLLSPMVITKVNKREKNFKDPSGLFFANLLPLITSGTGLLGITPREIRALIDFPIAVTDSEADAYFPTGLMRASREKEQRELFERSKSEKQKSAPDADLAEKLRLSNEAHQEAGMFPNAPEVFITYTPNLPHSGTTVDPERVSTIAVDIFSRMLDSGKNGVKGIVTHLNYSRR